MRLALLTFSIVSFSLVCYASEGSSLLTQPSTRIEVDDEADVIRFFINGELEAVLDGKGFHVRDNVTYGGVVIDTGSEYFEESFGAEAGHDAL